MVRANIVRGHTTFTLTTLPSLAANVCITGAYFDPMSQSFRPSAQNSGPAGLLVSTVKRHLVYDQP